MGSNTLKENEKEREKKGFRIEKSGIGYSEISNAETNYRKALVQPTFL